METRKRLERASGVVLIGVLVALLLSPAGAHVTRNANHDWNKHFLPLALQSF